MSQAGAIDVIGNNPSIATNFIANSGNAVPILNTIEILGTSVVAGVNPVRTIASGNTLTIQVQRSQAIVATDATKVGLSSFNSAQFSVDANGFVSLGGGGLAIDSVTPNSGTSPIVPDVNGNINIVGTGSITNVGSVNTGTIQLTGLTANSVLYGLGTATIGLLASGTTGQVLQTNTGAAPTYSTATYPSTTTINQILYSSANNVISGLATANRAVLTTGTTGIPVLTALAVDGQVIIGSTTGSPVAGSITSTGGTLIITAGSNTLNLEVTGGGFTWTDATNATYTIAVQNGYVTDRGGGVNYTLPATALLGQEFIILGKLGLATITPNANQQLLLGSISGTVGVTGTCVSTNVGDSITFVCITAGASTVWRAVYSVGSWTIS